jgi:hypothetical protein
MYEIYLKQKTLQNIHRANDAFNKVLVKTKLPGSHIGNCIADS